MKNVRNDVLAFHMPPTLSHRTLPAPSKPNSEATGLEPQAGIGGAPQNLSDRCGHGTLSTLSHHEGDATPTGHKKHDNFAKKRDLIEFLITNF
jgi:hypothetical protein